jgi:hypothetical protein
VPGPWATVSRKKSSLGQVPKTNEEMFSFQVASKAAW